MYDFDGKVAIVTGASSGIGWSTATMLADRGARVVAFARSGDKLQELVRPHEGRMVACAGDVAELSAIDRAFAMAESRFGHIDLVVNNAGMIEPMHVVDMTLALWERTFAVNVRGMFLACRRALPSMLERGRGAIVNVASISGIPGPDKFPGYTAYCASKGAVISFTEALAVEVKSRGVRVNSVSPGAVDTPMWARASDGAPASMSPEEVAETILFLLSDVSRPMNGQDVHVFSA